MTTRKVRSKTTTTKLYSYDEFRKTFYPDSDSELPVSQDPKVFGRKLGEEAVKRIREQAQARAQPK